MLLFRKRTIALLLALVFIAVPLASCNSGGGSSSSSGINADAKVVALEGDFASIQSKLESAGVTAIRVDIYSEDYDDGACLGFTDLPTDTSSGEAYSVLVNNKNMASQLEQDKLIPRIIEKNSFEENIAKPISSNDSDKKKLDAYYTLFDPSADATDAEKETMHTQYPYTLTGGAVYVLDSSAKEKDLQTLESLIKEKTEYTFEKLLADYVKVQVIPTPKEYLKADVVSKENSDFEKTSDGLVLKSYNGTSGAVYVPATIDGENVYGLGEGAFSSSYIHSVVLAEGIKDISTKAFSRASGLSYLTIPSTIEGIGEDAFGSVVFTKTENNFKTVFDTVLLAYSGSDAEVTIPDSILHIGGSAFKSNKNLTKVNFPNTLLSIGDGAFYKCAKLTSADISKTEIKRVGDEAFASDARLTSVVISDKVTTVGDKAFFECSDVTTFTLGSNIETIGDDAFNNLWLIDNVTLPSTLKSIGDRAFYKCRALKTLTGGDNLESAGQDAFTETVYINTVKNSGEFGVIGKGILLTYSGRTTDVTVPDNVTYISNAFAGNGAIKSVTLTDKVTGICNEAFKDCSNLTSLKVPSADTTIGDNCFSGCSSELTVKCASGSVAETFCLDSKIKVEAL